MSMPTFARYRTDSGLSNESEVIGISVAAEIFLVSWCHIL